MEIKRPLAYRERPKNLYEVVGQDHILRSNGVINRMNKDVQDFLLPHVEEGNVIMIGLTTVNQLQNTPKNLKDEIIDFSSFLTYLSTSLYLFLVVSFSFSHFCSI